ncbi:N-glycosylase/DNA lyase [Nakaseomyces glabratus]|uniref:DNA-(apurinic or apyrimidinic site) lyase n=1 Tax=Candida glabrata TaxID=5478 RepID=A0A0W0CEC9_CANGB|nr:N-glycosylase/DNA lyase [Nakaseomyces glabratus]
MSINGLLNVSAGELCLKNVLQTGQSFRWLLDEATGIYSTTLKISDTLGYSIITLRQDVDFGQVFYEVLNAKVDTETIENHLKNYFRLDVDLQNLHKNHWLANDEKFKMLDHKGIRILGQEPWETLVSFICSTNNNIGRISKMCHALSENFGEYIDEYKGTKYYTFPSSEDIATKATEIQLRGLGFGYRAKYIIETAKKFVEDKKKLKFTEIWGEYAGWAQGLLFFRETDKSDASAAKKRKTTSSPAASKKPKLDTNELVSAISVKAE